MPLGLKRYQNEGDDHFITFSCYNREPYLNTPASRDTFLDSLELTRKRYRFEVLGYVVMPEHIHLLVSEPPSTPLSKALQSLKLSVSKRLTQRPFWHTRYKETGSSAALWNGSAIFSGLGASRGTCGRAVRRRTAGSGCRG